MPIDPLENMANRAEQCRQLASFTRDEKMKWQLIEWANAIEADIEKLKQVHNPSSGVWSGTTSMT